jgi:hypothetical protein
MLSAEQTSFSSPFAVGEAPTGCFAAGGEFDGIPETRI